MTANTEAVAVLNRLIETTLDSVAGYRVAARGAESPRFRTLFSERARRRWQIAAALRLQVRTLGGKPSRQGTLLGAAHRLFLKLRTLLSGHDESIIEEIEAGEDHILSSYEGALKSGTLPPAAREAVGQAHAAIKNDHKRVSNLRAVLGAI